MDKELQDGAEQEDTWPGEGAEVLARNLLVDGETGESFPAQVLSPPLSPRNFLEKAVVSMGGTWIIFGVGVSRSVMVRGLRKDEWTSRTAAEGPGLGNKQSRGGKAPSRSSRCQGSSTLSLSSPRVGG